jgi:tRNA U34 5-methylaminomethyl-2-thiouridine-forming methyltransferase MnmC
MNPTTQSREETYELVQLANGTFSIRSLANRETFHPVVGPIEEATTLYVRQLKLAERAASARPTADQLREGGHAREPFVIWDVGLGAGGNVLTSLHALKEVDAKLRIVSFDHTLGALRFALEHGAQLQFPAGFENVLEELLGNREAEFSHGALQVHWEIHLADFPKSLMSMHSWPAPHAIFFDAFSPARNPEMWTFPLFDQLYRSLDPHRPCALATYSRSTIARVTLLLAGFFVGAGEGIAAKEETTIAANTLDLIDRPLGARWLERARTSHSAEPIGINGHQIAPLAEETWARLRAHPQFN